jgi:hypothetical protein
LSEATTHGLVAIGVLDVQRVCCFLHGYIIPNWERFVKPLIHINCAFFAAVDALVRFGVVARADDGPSVNVISVFHECIIAYFGGDVKGQVCVFLFFIPS